MYSMDIGDELNFRQSHWCFFPPQGGSYTLKRTVTNRQNVGTDSVDFELTNVITSSSAYANGPCWSPGYPSAYSINNLDEYEDNYLPEELYLGDSGNQALRFHTINQSLHCGNQLLVKYLGLGYFWGSNDIIDHAIETSEGFHIFLEGFGRAHSSGDFFTGSSYYSLSGSIYQFDLGTLDCGDITIGLEEKGAPTEIQLYPNPSATSSFTISLPAAIKEGTSIQMYDMLGNVIPIEIESFNYSVKISMKNYAVGMYTIKINTTNGIHTRRVHFI